MFSKLIADELFNFHNAWTTQSYRPQVYVVSDSAIKGMHERQQERTIKAIDNQISQLEDYKNEVNEYYTNTLKLVKPTETKE
tara:strand:- start:135 stop:380 length:246 start_codon:yes stop_codon:yes gene_type:complete